MRNRYPGICYRCGKVVKKGDGHFEKDSNPDNPDKWRTIHAACVFEQREEKAKKLKQQYEKKEKENTL